MRKSKVCTQKAAGAPRQSAGDDATPHTSGEGCAPLPQLPLHLLAQVLQHDPLWHRLTAAAAVSKAWREAAAATVTSVTYTHKRLSELRLTRMLAWAATQASHLTHLQLCASFHDVGRNPLLQQLQLPPTAQLKSLSLQNLQLQLGPGRGNAGILTGLSPLTSLKLQRNSLLDGATGLKYLSAITSLQELQLAGSPGAGLRFPSGVLSRLVQLTRLALCNMEVPATALRGLSLLSGLKQLTLKPQTYAGTPLSHAVLRVVAEQQQLTRLELGATAAPISNSSTPGFSRLTALQVLAVKEAMTAPGRGLHPEVLVGMTGLSELDLGGSVVLGGEAGVAGLFALPALRQLQRLDLINSLVDLLPETSAVQYSALTSSSQLSSLALTGCMLPSEGAWPLLFNRQLPQLRHLILNAAETAPLTTADLQLIARRCPGLRELCVLSLLDEAADLAVLQGFSELTCLVLDRVDDDHAVTLAHLTRLWELVVTAPNDLSPYALCDLSNLKQLTHFCVYDEPVDTMGDELPEETAVRWFFVAEDPEDEPVWEQMYDTYYYEADPDGF